MDCPAKAGRGSSGPSLALRAFATLAGPLDLLTRYARRGSPFGGDRSLVISAFPMTQPPPADPQLLVQQARGFRQQGQFENALASYDQALAVQPDLFEALYNRGILLWEMKRDEDALASLEKAIAIRPGYAATWNNRGNVLRNLGRPEEALASFDQALALKPDFPGAHYNRANVLLLNLKRAGEALADYDRALALNPGFAEAWNNRGNALCSLGRLAESVASYDRALAIRPDFVDAMNCRGQVLFESNRIEEGVETFMRAAALLPEQNPLNDPPHKVRHDREQQDYLAGISGRYSAPAGAGWRGLPLRRAMAPPPNNGGRKNRKSPWSTIS